MALSLGDSDVVRSILQRRFRTQVCGLRSDDLYNIAMSSLQQRPSAGLKLDSVAERPDGVPLKKGEYSIASRALALSTYFFSGALAINLSQYLGTPLYLVNQDWYNAWIAFTKQSFGLLTMSLTQAFAPTKVIVSGDASVRGQFRVSADGNLILDFPQRLILIANHQIYTDWLYLWWIAYCNGMHGRLYIILKESLKRIPVLGWGMQMSQFIFLKRKWEQDKPHMASALEKLNKPNDPMWLMLFPEGTNLAPSTREKSAAWAKKNGMKDMFHTLIPRSTGLQFCLQELHGTVDYLYDCTVAYEGVPRGQFAQDIFTLKSGYLEGRPPKSVHMYWRRFAVKDIPFQNEKTFELWLTARWREKDLLIENYLRTGNFPADRGFTKFTTGRTVQGSGHSEVQIRSSHWYEFLQIFAPMGVLAMILAVFYGALPQSFWNSFNKQAIKSSTQDIKKASQQAGTQVKSAANTASGLTLDDVFDKDKQEESFKKGAYAVQKWLNTPQAQTMMNRADFLSSFVQNPEQAVAGTLKTQRKDFMHAIQEEEEKRRTLQLPNSAQNVGVQKGTFWKDLDRLDNSRHGSVVSAPSSKPAGTFWADLQAAEQNKAKGLEYGGRGKFWDKIQREENARFGTVRTLSSSASSRGGTVKTLSSNPTTVSRSQPLTTIATSKTVTPVRTVPAPKNPAAPKAPSTVGSIASPAPKKLPSQAPTGAKSSSPTVKPKPLPTTPKAAPKAVSKAVVPIAPNPSSSSPKTASTKPVASPLAKAGTANKSVKNPAATTAASKQPLKQGLASKSVQQAKTPALSSKSSTASKPSPKPPVLNKKPATGAVAKPVTSTPAKKPAPLSTSKK